MTDHNFTDDELQRCIECCIKGKVWGDCKKLNCPAIRKQGCHFYLRTDDDYENTIYIEILKDALALINRQKADNERLQNKVEELSEVLSDTIRIRYAECKAEAIKEFAERLKPKLSYYDWVIVDTLVKEMTEGNK